MVTDSGRAVAVGERHAGQCTVPALADGERYVHASAGDGHTVCITSWGRAVAFGGYGRYGAVVYGQCTVPALADGERYASVGWLERGHRAWVATCLVARRSGQAELQAVADSMAGGLERTLWAYLVP